MYIAVAVLVFGFLIATHELGHFLVAKAFGVKVNEFAIGMGPAIVKKQKGETLYSLRALPIGGFCAMEGEDGDSEDERSFSNQKVWKRFLVLIAGSSMNFLTGLIIVAIVFSSAGAFRINRIETLSPGFEYGGEAGLIEGDAIISIDGHRIFYHRDFVNYMSRAAGKDVDMVIERDGRKIALKDFGLSAKATAADGEAEDYGITFAAVKATPGERLKYSLYTTYDFVRLVKMGLSDLITGRVGVKDMSGALGIITVINDVGENSETSRDAAMNIAYLCAFIAVNLAVMNMLPIPALDGGRVFFLFVTAIIEKLTRKKLNPKYEAYINTVALGLLIVLMAYVMFNDVLRIIHK